MERVRNDTITVAIIDTNPVLSDALCTALAQQDGLAPGRGVWSGDGQVALSTGGIPHVVLIDPLAFDAQPAQVRHNAPTSALIAYLPGTDSEQERVCAKASLVAGFRGLMTKQARSDEIAMAIGMVARGGFYVEGNFGDIMRQSRLDVHGGRPARATLTERETFVLQAVARGMSMKEIGGELDLSTKTIETYKARASSKLNLQSRRDIVDYAIRSGWIQSIA